MGRIKTEGNFPQEERREVNVGVKTKTLIFATRPLTIPGKGVVNGLFVFNNYSPNLLSKCRVLQKRAMA